MTRKRWSDEEMALALYRYRFGYEDLGMNYSQIGDLIGRSPSSIIMRFANYLSAEREGSGLDGGGLRVKEVYNQYINKAKGEFRNMVLDYLHNLNRE